MPDQVQKPVRVAAFKPEIREIEALRKSAIRRLLEVAPQHRLLIYQADWHLRGLTYHLGRMHRLYGAVAKEVGGRALAAPDIIIMYSTDMQSLIFEFYAFINLARITLDQLQRFAAPTFPGATLPNSITDVLKRTSDSPVYNRLSGSDKPLLQYLLDIRDCIVHHRTFATPDNTVAVRQDFPEEAIPNLQIWFRPLVRAIFRVEGSDKVVVNILLPDAVWAYSEGGTRGAMLPSFSYTKGINLMSQAREFSRMCTAVVLLTLTNVATGEKYHFHK